MKKKVFTQLEFFSKLNSFFFLDSNTDATFARKKFPYSLYSREKLYCNLEIRKKAGKKGPNDLKMIFFWSWLKLEIPPSKTLPTLPSDSRGKNPWIEIVSKLHNEALECHQFDTKSMKLYLQLAPYTGLKCEDFRPLKSLKNWQVCFDMCLLKFLT